MFPSNIACPETSAYSFADIICQLTFLVLEIVPVLIALALLLFFWGIATWIFNMENEEKMKEGRERMVWGLVALFFILSIGGVIAMLMNTFFGAGSLGARAIPQNAPIQRQINIQPGTVSAPVQVGASPQTTSSEPGFFRQVWCRIGFGSCE